MTSAADRRRALEILDGAVAAGAPATRVADRMAISLRTLQRWRRQFAVDGDGGDRRKATYYVLATMTDATCLCMFDKDNLQQLGEVLQAWVISQIPDGGTGLDQLVCDRESSHIERLINLVTSSDSRSAPRPIERTHETSFWQGR